MSDQGIFDNLANVKKVIYGLFLVCFILAILGFFVSDEHAHFGWETYPQFYGAFGFLAFVILVLAAKHFLRPIVKRKENYYDK